MQGWFYNGLILLFGFAAINTGNNLLYLILAVMIGTTLASFWLSEMTISEITLEREMPETVHAGQDFLIQYKLKNNRKFWPNAAIEILEKVEDKTLLAFFTLVRARTQETAFVHAGVTRRGRHEFGEFLIRTYFPFGLFEKTKKANLKAELVVMPSAMGGEPNAPASASQLGMIRPGSKGPARAFRVPRIRPGRPPSLDRLESQRPDRAITGAGDREGIRAVNHS